MRAPPLGKLLFVVCVNNPVISPPPTLESAHTTRSAAVRAATLLALSDCRADTGTSLDNVKLRRSLLFSQYWIEECDRRAGRFTRSGGDQAIWVTDVSFAG